MANDVCLGLASELPLRNSFYSPRWESLRVGAKASNMSLVSAFPESVSSRIKTLHSVVFRSANQYRSGQALGVYVGTCSRGTIYRNFSQGSPPSDLAHILEDEVPGPAFVQDLDPVDHAFRNIDE